MHQPIPADSDPLRQAANAFTQWRSSRKNRARIPEPLWKMACQATQVHGVSKTAQTLKLDYYRLQRRIQGKTGSPRQPVQAAQDGQPSPAAAAFVELPTMSTGNGRAECELEFQNGQGTRLVVRWKESSAPDLALLAQVVQPR